MILHPDGPSPQGRARMMAQCGLRHRTCGLGDRGKSAHHDTQSQVTRALRQSRLRGIVTVVPEQSYLRIETPDSNKS